MNYNSIRRVLIEKVNRSDWWHVPPRDKIAYTKRGKFLSSTYTQAEFYGRPNIDPERVQILNPVFGFTEGEIMYQLFGIHWCNDSDLVVYDDDSYEKKIEVDHKMYIKAKSMGYDSIVLMAESGRKALLKGRKPNFIELNLLEV